MRDSIGEDSIWTLLYYKYQVRFLDAVRLLKQNFSIGV